MKALRLLGIAAFAFGFAAAAQAQQGKTVKIGVVLPYSGANAGLGHQIDKAFRDARRLAFCAPGYGFEKIAA